MSSITSPPRISWRTVAILIAIAISTLSLQLLLPYGSYQLAGSHPDDPIDHKNREHGRDFWRERLRFDAMLRLELPASCHACGQFGSCAICGDELVIIMKEFPWPFDTDNPREIVRVNLRTGRITTSAAPADVHDVLSDGQRLWFLPQRIGLTDPFLQAGRPVGIQRVYSVDEDRQFLMIEFVDGEWRPSDQYLIGAGLLRGFDSHTPGVFTDDHVGQHRLVCVNARNAYMFNGLKIGSAEDVANFRRRGINMPEHMMADERREMGVTKLEIDDQRLKFFGCWMEDDLPCLIAVEHRDPDMSSAPNVPFDPGVSLRFIVCRLHPDAPPDTVYEPLIYRARDSYESSETWFRVASSANSEHFVICGDTDYDLLYILRRENGRFHVLAARASRRMQWVLIDAATFASFAVAIPMLFLAVSAWIIQRCRPKQLLAFGRDSAHAASILRRGIARAIDLSIPAALIIRSIVVHPNGIFWWVDVMYRLWNSFDLISSLPTDASWDNVLSTAQELSNLPITIFSAHVIWWFFLPAILIIIGQVVLQGRTGRTIGKWLLGIKVLRTTFRPCGIARSLLRELLLAVDSVCLLSWVPGVVSILATRQSQRLGDLLADTIVIRDQAPRPREPTI